MGIETAENDSPILVVGANAASTDRLSGRRQASIKINWTRQHLMTLVSTLLTLSSAGSTPADASTQAESTLRRDVPSLQLTPFGSTWPINIPEVLPSLDNYRQHTPARVNPMSQPKRRRLARGNARPNRGVKCQGRPSGKGRRS